MSTRRRSRRCALLLAIAATTLIGGSGAGASRIAVLDGEDSVAGPASALSPAVRVGVPKSGVVFPMNPLPYCLALDNYGDPRSGGRTHQGTDIMGYYKWTAGQVPSQEVYAVVDGTLGNQKIDGNADAVLSGNSWRLYASANEPTYYMYAHLSRFAEGLQNGSVVRQGQVIGYVGDTGDPGDGNYHLHFEVHPTGNSNVVVDPMPLLRPVMPPSCLGR